MLNTGAPLLCKGDRKDECKEESASEADTEPLPEQWLEAEAANMSDEALQRRMRTSVTDAMRTASRRMRASVSEAEDADMADATSVTPDADAALQSGLADSTSFTPDADAALQSGLAAATSVTPDAEYEDFWGGDEQRSSTKRKWKLARKWGDTPAAWRATLTTTPTPPGWAPPPHLLATTKAES